MSAPSCVLSKIVLLALLTLMPITARAEAEWHSFQGGRWRDLEAVSPSKPGFTLLDPARTGVLFTNSLTEEQAATNRTLYNGSGVATGDIDGDGRPDIVLAGLNNQLTLFRNLGNFQFSNITETAGLRITNLICRGVVLADIDGDGALDLLLGTSGSGVHCWKNDGRGHFSEFTKEAGTATHFASYSLALADVDGNGTLNLYVANNRSEDIRDRGQVQLRSVRGQPVVPPSLTNRLVLQNGQLLEYGEPDFLYLNDGKGHFHAASWTDGTFRNEEGKPLTHPPLDWGLTATFRDLNDDGFPDLYVCNDFWTPDRIWLNDGKGHFRAAPALAFRKTSGSSMGVDMADLDGDGQPEIFVLDMLSRSVAWRKRQMAAQAPFINTPGDIQSRPQVPRNTFFHARADGTYEEMANYAGLAASEWAWQPLFIDVDLDGQLDLLITTGHPHDVQDRDAEAQVQARQKNYSAIRDPAERHRVFTADLLANNQIYPKLQTPIVAFHNKGNLTFEDATESWGTAQLAVHHGIAVADFDGDGDLDLAVNNLNSPAAVYRNEAGAGRIALRLKGQSPNVQAIGAVAVLRGDGAAEQRQEIVAGGRYLSGSDSLLVFAAKTNEANCSLQIRWRNGTQRTIKNVVVNRLYELDEDPAIDIAAAATNENRSAPAKWFVDASERLQSNHFETLYDDFFRQPLLPYRLSQLGPGVAWTDLDGDGWEDLAIGTGAGGTLGVFRNDQHGGFAPWSKPPFNAPQPRDTTALLSLPRANGASAILAGAANYEDGRTNAACLLMFEANSPGPRATLRDFPSSAGPLALADYTGDGSLGLFVGARVRAGLWPEAGGSMLLKENHGAWSRDEENTKTVASDQCVSAAIWSDLEGSGFPDLVLVGEYAPVRIFRNNRGTLQPWNAPVTAAGALASIKNLDGLTGLWISVNAGDFDGDGRLDLILGNWGENGFQKATPLAPLVLAAVEAVPGSLSVIETSYDSRGLLTPVRPLNELALGLPFLAGRFSSFRQFSEATLDEILSPVKSEVRTFRANTLKTILLLNRGDHFELRELPREAQLAPVFGICIADFDLDGHEDIFLAQNFSATRPGIPRLDAGRGLMLHGDASGNFAGVDGSESGLAIYGDQRGAAVADYDHDGRPDLVVTQNGAATSLFRNQINRTGLRVILHGPATNPHGIGATVRLVGMNFSGPAREIHSGSGYWSQDAPVVILTPPANTAVQLETRWPGGKITRTAVPEGAKEISAHF